MARVIFFVDCTDLIGAKDALWPPAMSLLSVSGSRRCLRTTAGVVSVTSASPPPRRRGLEPRAKSLRVSARRRRQRPVSRIVSMTIGPLRVRM
jgi:hypothetical protein